MNILEGQKLIKLKEFAKALTFFLDLKKYLEEDLGLVQKY